MRAKSLDRPPAVAGDMKMRLTRVISELDRQLRELDDLGILTGAGDLDLAIARLRSVETAGPVSGAGASGREHP